jgi:hypothetical protein
LALATPECRYMRIGYIEMRLQWVAEFYFFLANY